MKNLIIFNNIFGNCNKVQIRKIHFKMWSCSYTGIASVFNAKQKIGISTYDINEAVVPDFTSISTQCDIRTFMVAPGTELAVKAAVALVIEQRKEVTAVEFRYVACLKTEDHITPGELAKRASKTSEPC